MVLQLDLSDNQLCGIDNRGRGTYTAEGITAIADALRVNGTLTVTNLLRNRLDAESAKMLAEVAKQKGVLLYGIQRDQTTADFSRGVFGGLFGGGGGGLFGAAAKATEVEPDEVPDDEMIPEVEHLRPRDREPSATPGQGRQDMTEASLAAAPPEQQKQLLGDCLFPLISQVQPALAGKITGMLLEMDNGELLNLLESPEALNAKITEAVSVLAAAPPEQQKRLLGECLFPLISQVQPAFAGKITGMLLEMDNGELLNLLESPEALNAKIVEAVSVLETMGQPQAYPPPPQAYPPPQQREAAEEHRRREDAKTALDAAMNSNDEAALQAALHAGQELALPVELLERGVLRLSELQEERREAEAMALAEVEAAWSRRPRQPQRRRPLGKECPTR